MRVLAVGLALAVLAFGAAPSVDPPREAATALARKASRAEKAGEDAQAYIYYAEASALQPKNRKYAAKMELLRTSAGRQSPPVVMRDPAAEPEHPVIDPFDSMTERELAQARSMNDVQRLRGKEGPQSLDLTGNSRSLYDKVTAAFGLEPVYDGDYPKDDPPMHFKVDQVNYHQALELLQVATSSFLIPLSPKVLMVAKDTAQKRTELEQTISVSVPLPPILTTQELTEIAQVVRQATNVEKIAWDTTQARIVIRDRVSRVVPAMALLDQLLSYRPEVMLDLEFLQVSSSDLKNYGFNVTDSFQAYYLGQVLRAALPTGVSSLLTFGGGKSLIGLGVAQVEAMFNETNTTGNSLYQAQIRSVAGQPATLHVGEKYPVLTSGFVGQPSQQPGNYFAPPPSFTFEDLGLTLKVTPFVHGMGEVTLTIETSFEVLTGQAINNIPVIGRRSLNSQVRLKNGEWAILGGIMSTTKSKANNGFAGLAQLPLLGYMFRQTSTDDEDNNVLIGIRPHLLSLPPDQLISHRMRVGSDTRPYTPY
ncbi:MAG TPA: type II and III secretion system protein [Bryobacteraceae bacterium]|nr:type II and III secretion system protein [Bryobacteraceae bacterium]